MSWAILAVIVGTKTSLDVLKCMRFIYISLYTITNIRKCSNKKARMVSQSYYHKKNHICLRNHATRLKARSFFLFDLCFTLQSRISQLYDSYQHMLGENRAEREGNRRPSAGSCMA